MADPIGDKADGRGVDARPMTENEVVDLMESSGSEAEWNANCDKVKAACNGYPDFWFAAIVLSGLANRVAARWGGDDRIRVTSI